MKKDFGDREERETDAEKKEEPGSGRQPAWYERDEGETPWFEKPVGRLSQEPENVPEPPRPTAPPRGRSAKADRSKSAQTKEELDLNGLFEAGKKGKTKKRAPRTESGKIYLPAPPPAFLSDTVSNEVLYIERNFEANPALANGGKKKGNPLIPLGGILASLLCAALGVLMLLYSEEYPEGAFFTAVGVVMAGVFFVVLLRGFKKKIRARDFRLVKPYAVKKEFSFLHGLADGEATLAGAESRQVFLFDGGLRLYYEEKGKKREAVTEKIYSETELDELVAAFLKGELVAACRRSGGEGFAVVCSPDVKGGRRDLSG